MWFTRCRRNIGFANIGGSTFRVKCDSRRGFSPPGEPLLFLEERVPECDRGECQFRVNAVSAGKKCNLAWLETLVRASMLKTFIGVR